MSCSFVTTPKPSTLRDPRYEISTLEQCVFSLKHPYIQIFSQAAELLEKNTFHYFYSNSKCLQLTIMQICSFIPYIAIISQAVFFDSPSPLSHHPFTQQTGLCLTPPSFRLRQSQHQCHPFLE